MSIVVNVILLTVTCMIIGFAVKLITEAVKLQRNPIPRMQNHDKRFSEIDNEYLHEMYSVKLR